MNFNKQIGHLSTFYNNLPIKANVNYYKFINLIIKKRNYILFLMYLIYKTFFVTKTIKI